MRESVVSDELPAHVAAISAEDLKKDRGRAEARAGRSGLRSRLVDGLAGGAPNRGGMRGPLLCLAGLAHSAAVGTDLSASTGRAPEREHRRHESILVTRITVVRGHVQVGFGVELDQCRCVGDGDESLVGRVEGVILGTRGGFLLIIQRSSIGHLALVSDLFARRDLFHGLNRRRVGLEPVTSWRGGRDGRSDMGSPVGFQFGDPRVLGLDGPLHLFDHGFELLKILRRLCAKPGGDEDPCKKQSAQRTCRAPAVECASSFHPG